jgi:hypothetical protein
VRGFLLLFCLTIVARPLAAQQQERKLVDRLLKPDLSLSNPAQNKKFAGTDATPATKEFVAKPFYSGKARPAKRFAGVKDFFTSAFGTWSFSRGNAIHRSANQEWIDARRHFETKQSTLIGTSSEATKLAPVRDYADQRPFRGKGTRQEILSQQNHPLTIDEVRELLNKGE